jgi:hypothetical protein
LLLPEWVRPSVAQVDDLELLAWRLIFDGDEIDAQRGKGIILSVGWLCRTGSSPATMRTERPITRPMALAETFAAAALSDGGGTTERMLRDWCAQLGVQYWPPAFGVIGLDEGYAIYQTLSWMAGNLDGWEGGRTPPLEIPARLADRVTLADDARTQELVALVVDCRRRGATGWC